MGTTLTRRLLPFKRSIIEKPSAPGELELGGMPVRNASLGGGRHVDCRSEREAKQRGIRIGGVGGTS